MVAKAAVDAGLLAVDGAGERPEDALGAQVLALFLGDVLARRQVVSAAEMPIAGAGDDGAADVAVFPDVDPRLGDRVRGLLVENVGLFRVVQRDIATPSRFW